MNIQTILDPIDKAINAESWEWLTTNQPRLADAIHSAVSGGASPDAIYRYMMARLHGGERAGIALRCKQAASHLGEANHAQR